MYFSWKIDRYRGQDAFQARWTHIQGYAFSPFCLIGKVLWKVQTDLADLIDNTSLANSGVVSSATSLINQEPNPYPSDSQLTAKPTKSIPPINSEQSSVAGGFGLFQG